MGSHTGKKKKMRQEGGAPKGPEGSPGGEGTRFEEQREETGEIRRVHEGSQRRKVQIIGRKPVVVESPGMDVEKRAGRCRKKTSLERLVLHKANSLSKWLQP